MSFSLSEHKYGFPSLEPIRITELSYELIEICHVAVLLIHADSVHKACKCSKQPNG